MLFKISFVFSLFLCLNAKEFIENNNELALHLLHVLTHDLSSNQFFSPISLSSSLFTLLNGAKGQTQEELKALFNIQDLSKIEDLNKEMKLLLESIAKKEETIKIANKILVSNEVKLEETFDKTVKDYFNSSVSEVNFGTNAKNVTKNLNQWVSDITNGKIPKLFKDSLDSDSALVLVNAIYFAGKWMYPFNKVFTDKGDFLNSNNVITKIDFMTNQKKFKTKSLPDLKSTLIDVPFKGNLSLIILLPKELNNLELLSDNLTLKALKEALDEIDRTEAEDEIILTLPKFRIESEYDLKEPLEELEVKSLFDESVDLSGISGDKNLKVSQAIHRATLDVNEVGVEASAASGFEVIPVIEVEIPPIIKVDKPFIFFIRDQTNGLILFSGKVNTLVDEELLSFGFV